MIIITGVNGFIGKCLFNYYKFIRKQKVIGFDKEFEINFYKENEEDLYFFDFVKDDKSDFIQLIEDKMRTLELDNFVATLLKVSVLQTRYQDHYHHCEGK